MECQLKLMIQKQEMKRLHEIAQMSYEEEQSKSFALLTNLDSEIERSRMQISEKNKSEKLTLEEKKID